MSECPHGMPLYNYCEECSGPAPVEPDPQKEVADLKRRITTLESELRSWPEDRASENGNYECICVTCGKRFIGHKRRIVCRDCK